MKLSLNYFQDLFKTYFKNRRVAFFIAFAMAIVSIVTSIIYVAALGHLTNYMSWAVFNLLLFGGLIFLILSYFKLESTGSAVLAIMSFSSFLVFAGTIYKFPMEMIMVVSNVFDIKEMPAIIIVASLMIICAVTSNVCAWITSKKDNVDNAKTLIKES